ncbi:ABC-2 type transport system ATP-binding protein [Streptomyces misionensis]|uniref:ABC-2 type transport system ATP-binding protein n=1 Tax=Streptomyces misionensis TaxID=67331 RepID=A0A1H4IAA3_9ACTN|nr:ABC transporter ATP-binding protein [Streptomyces misionensis]SEB30987.1 ABC-2 type transport system ATP-binding protein [Streptomyces misionensis]
MGTTTKRPAAPPAPAIALEGVSKRYGDVRAVDDLTVTVEPGQTVGLLGPNGAGKSTTLDILLGLVRPDSGQVRLFGQRPADAIRAGLVGAMLQTGGLMPEVKVRDLIRLVHRLAQHPLPVKTIMSQAGIEDIAGHRVDKLSGGQRQRIRFALAIVEDPDLVVLDEPTAGMDVATRNQFWETMRAQTRAGRTLLFATHYMEEADNAADRILVMHQGRLLADTTPAAMKARTGLRRMSFTCPGADVGQLRGLPGVVDAQAHGDTAVLHSADSDATVEAMVLGGPRPRDLEITGLGLEQAYLSITQDPGGERSGSDPQPLGSLVTNKETTR